MRRPTPTIRKVSTLRSIRLESGGETMVDPAQFLVGALLSDNRPSVMVYLKRANQELYVAGVDCDLLSGLPAKVTHRTWFWPVATPERRQFDQRKPRYRDLRSAVIASVRMKGGKAAYVVGRNTTYDNDDLYVGGIRVRPSGWFDDPDYVEEGTVQKWWTGWFNKAPTTETVSWLGSDDPMRW